MKRTIIALTAAGALAAGTVGMPQAANALPVWVVPVIIAAGVGGLAVGGAVGSQHAYAQDVGPHGTVYVRPAGCHIERVRTSEGWRNAQVCP